MALSLCLKKPSMFEALSRVHVSAILKSFRILNMYTVAPVTHTSSI